MQIEFIILIEFTNTTEADSTIFILHNLIKIYIYLIISIYMSHFISYEMWVVRIIFRLF